MSHQEYDNLTNGSLGKNSTDHEYINNILRLGFYTPLDDYIIGTLIITFAVIGVVTNGFTIFIVGLGKNLSKQGKILIVNLAVADMLIAAVTLPVLMIYLLELSIPENSAFCKLMLFADSLVNRVAAWCYAALGIERLFVVFYPLKVSRYNSKHKLMIVGGMWISMLLISIDSLVLGELIVEEDLSYCDIVTPLKQTNPLTYELLNTLIYLLPETINIVCYALIFVKLCRRKSDNGNHHQSSQTTDKQNKLLLMLAVDAGLGLVTIYPYDIYKLIHISNEAYLMQKYTERQLFAIDVSLSVLFSTIAFSSPLVYFIFNPYFRKDTWALFRLIFCCKRAQVMPQQTTRRINIGELAIIPKNSTTLSSEEQSSAASTDLRVST